MTTILLIDSKAKTQQKKTYPSILNQILIEMLGYKITHPGTVWRVVSSLHDIWPKLSRYTCSKSLALLKTFLYLARQPQMPHQAFEDAPVVYKAFGLTFLNKPGY